MVYRGVGTGAVLQENVVGNVFRLAVEACGEGDVVVMGIVRRRLAQGKGNHHMDHVCIMNGGLQYLGVQLGRGNAVFLHIVVEYMKIVFGDDIISGLSGTVGVRADHPYLVSLVPKGTDQVQRGNGGAVVCLTQYVTDHSYFHNTSLLYLFTHSNVWFALERVSYFQRNYKSPWLQNDKNSAKVLLEKGQNAKNDGNCENAIDKWKRLLYHGENKSKGYEEEQ